MSAIDDEIQSFFDKIASISWCINDYKRWMKEYEKQRDNYPNWITKNGEHIKIQNIENTHLDNLIKFMGKKDPENAWTFAFKYEKKYRELKKKIPEMENEYKEMRRISEIVF